MADTDALIDNLKKEVDKLESKFLTTWIPAKPEHTPDEFEHDIKAYCVLAHAVFEEFAEEISLAGMEESKKAWLRKQPIRGTFALLSAYGFQVDIKEKEDEEQENLFDQIRKGLDESKAKHSSALSNNHGFSLKYLRKILTPIGIDIPNEVKLLASLRDLADARGSYAHSQAQRALYGQWKQAKRPMTPEQARATVSDCVELCEKLADKLKTMIIPVTEQKSNGADSPVAAKPRLP